MTEHSSGGRAGQTTSPLVVFGIGVERLMSLPPFLYDEVPELLDAEAIRLLFRGPNDEYIMDGGADWVELNGVLEDLRRSIVVGITRLGLPASLPRSCLVSRSLYLVSTREYLHIALIPGREQKELMVGERLLRHLAGLKESNREEYEAALDAVASHLVDQWRFLLHTEDADTMYRDYQRELLMGADPDRFVGLLELGSAAAYRTPPGDVCPSTGHVAT